MTASDMVLLSKGEVTIMKSRVIKTVFDYAVISVGSLVLSIGMNLFLVPSQLSSGGVGTIGTILLHIFGIPLSVTTLIFNIILFAFGYRYLGRSSIIKTVVGILTLSLFLELTAHLPSVTSDVIVSTVAGGLLVGVGVGLAVRKRASTGGSDFAALIIKRIIPHVSLATVIFIIDCAIITVAGIVFRSFTVTFYSAVAMFVSSKVTDIIVSFGDLAKTIYIMSDRHREISDIIMKHFDRGITGIYSKGIYTESEGLMLLCVVSPKEVPYVVHMVRSIDKKAFIVINDSREVLGEGFKTETEYDKIEKQY